MQKPQLSKPYSLPTIKYRIRPEVSNLKQMHQYCSFNKKFSTIQPYWKQIRRENRRIKQSLQNQKQKRKKSRIATLSLSVKKEHSQRQQYSSKSKQKAYTKNLITKRKKIKSILVSNELIEPPANFQQSTAHTRPQIDENCEKDTDICSSAKVGSHYNAISLRKCEERLKSKKQAAISIYRVSSKVPRIGSEQLNRYQHNVQDQLVQTLKTCRHHKNQSLIKLLHVLPVNRAEIQPQGIEQFIEKLKLCNPLFDRICGFLAQVLIRLTSIRQLKKNQLLYMEGNPSKYIYIVLWGQFLLKGQRDNSNFRKYAFPGDSMAQELLFITERHAKLRPLSRMPRQQLFHLQTAKALTQSAVLYFSQIQFYQIRKDLTICGMKFTKDLLLIQNMMKWCFSKKYNIRPSIIC